MIAPIITEKIVDLANDTNYCFEVAPQGDGRSRYVDIVLLDNGNPYNIPSDATIVTIEGENAGGYNIYNECTFKENVVTIPLSNGLLSFAGLGKYQISIYGSNSSAVTSFKFNLFVTEAPYDVIDLMASDSYEALTNLIDKVNEVIESGGSGETVVKGVNKWIVRNGQPSSGLSGVNINDYYLNSSNGDIYKYETTGWTLTDNNIKEKVYIKYSNEPDGTDFSDDPSGKIYMGTCVSLENISPSDKSKYRWSLIKNGIKTIEQTVKATEDGGVNVIECTLDDGTTLPPWEIKNGSTGEPAGFGTPTYNNEYAGGIGEPEVIVTAHGSNTEKIFDFEFINIKGERGSRGTNWTTGNRITGNSTEPTSYPTGIEESIVGDFYLNNELGNIYKCTVEGNESEAKWVYVGPLRGTGGGGSDLAAGMDIHISADGIISVIDDAHRKNDSIIGRWSHAEGYGVIAPGDYSHAEGYESKAVGFESHAEGYNSLAVGGYSHAEGMETISSGTSSHTEGALTIASEIYSHAEGGYNIAAGMYSHAEGEGSGHFEKSVNLNLTFVDRNSYTSGIQYSFTYTINSEDSELDISSWKKIIVNVDGVYFNCNFDYYNHLIITAGDFDYYNFEKFVDKEVTIYNLIRGALGVASHSEGYQTLAYDTGSHSEGYNTKALYTAAHAEGFMTIAEAAYSHAEGQNTLAQGTESHAEGYRTLALGSGSHAEGFVTEASGEGSHAEGDSTVATGSCSHAEGNGAVASGGTSHAEGNSTKATGGSSHAEGSHTKANNENSHAEGYETEANGRWSHAEGHGSIASEDVCHAEGEYTVASGVISHAEGYQTIASGKYQHVSGSYNKEDNNKIFIVGVGTHSGDRRNGFSVDYNGNTYDIDGALRTQFSDMSLNATIYPDIVQYVGVDTDDYKFGKWYKKNAESKIFYAWVTDYDNKRIAYTTTLDNIDNTTAITSSYTPTFDSYDSENNILYLYFDITTAGWEPKDSSLGLPTVYCIYPSFYYMLNTTTTLYYYNEDNILVPYEYTGIGNHPDKFVINNVEYKRDSSEYKSRKVLLPFHYDESKNNIVYKLEWEEIINPLPIATESEIGAVKVDNESIIIDEDGTIHAVGGGGEGGTSNYNSLVNKPSINGVELSGNKTLEDLGIGSSIPEDGVLKLNSIVLIDKSTGDEYTLGIDNGKLFIESNSSSDADLAPGLYDEDNNLIVSWEDSGINDDCSNAKDIIPSTYPNTRKVVIKEGTTTISAQSFGAEMGNRCQDITSVIIPEGVETIGVLAFYYCTDLKSISLPSTLKSIGTRALYNCWKLKPLVVPDTVETIGADAFYGVPMSGINYHGSASGAPWGADYKS